jgi:hypothetical protein
MMVQRLQHHEAITVLQFHHNLEGPSPYLQSSIDQNVVLQLMTEYRRTERATCKYCAILYKRFEHLQMVASMEEGLGTNPL